MHIPVLEKEAIESLGVKSGGIYIDATLGGGGHAEAILKILNGTGEVVGIDRDRKILETTVGRLKQYENFSAINSNFSEAFDEIIKKYKCGVDGVLFDLGVSSFQLDQMDRGFSFLEASAPLDMRMDQSQKLKASDVVNSYERESLAYIFKYYGEEKLANKIANEIVKRRNEKYFYSVGDLVALLSKVYGAKRVKTSRKHFATDIFRALRMEVNKELESIEKALPLACKSLKTGGRVAVITFHSVEDRVVKNLFKQMNNPCVCPTDLPECACHKKAIIKIINQKPIIPSDEEINTNPRSRSAKMRVVERI